MVVLLGGQKSGRNNEVTVRQGSTVFVNQEISTVAVSSLWCKVKCSIAKVQNKRMSPLEQNNITLTKPAP